ncbi:CPBP family intramembrane glutamic endopeptidase [Anaeromicrobium sediminis]|uniref:CAAX prenyl protease 2/Lysostaphin resistance protein A-like domain-containing protein n=1 Tax=Anaeromicrobium sediminis TaxID=1478221 RepID=A0A267MP07_9FIRM|nr:type II CAAX endopeptidase family protein [Anaeromicrobium sediminis]PAB60553.1 hypothetical protein CCE28_03140 [Anaeromicrobium sediminis]
MEIETKVEERNMYKANMFLLKTIIWLMIVGFFTPQWALLPIGAFIPCAIYLYKNKERRRAILSKFKLIDMKTYLILFLIWISVLPTKLSVIFIFEKFCGSEMIEELMDFPIENMYVLIISTVVFPALFEELVMRGIVLDGYRDKSIHVAAFMNGLLFGMFHMNFFQFTHTFIAGIVMTYVVRITGSILSSMFIHFTNNGFPEVLNLLSEPSTDEMDFNISNNELLIYFIVSTMGIFMAVKLMKYLSKKYKVDISFKNKEVFSKEKIINGPLITIGCIFFLMSMLIMSMYSGA